MNRILILVIIVAAAAAAWLVLSTGPSGRIEAVGNVLQVEQAPGKVVYWILPGPRRIDEAVFGTPDDPQMTARPQIERAKGPVKALLQELPILVGLPPQARETSADGTHYTRTKIPTPFGDDGQIVSGRLDVTYIDRQRQDSPGDPTGTQDEIKLDLQFTDPAGNEYQVEPLKVFMPPLPGYETQGGVMIDGYHHGATGTGSPLMPRVYTYGAFWGIGNVIINGQVADERKVVHCMTTNTVRDAQYRLAFNEELPLDPEKTIAGQIHHTHCIVLPVTITPQGPQYEPVKTAFTLPGGQMQPFIHIMFEQDEITRVSPGLSLPTTYEQQQERLQAMENARAPQPEPENKKALEAVRSITVAGSEFQFEPATIELGPGETVEIVFKNVGQIAHNYTIPALEVGTETIPAGTSDTITFTAPQESGTYPIRYECTVPGHSEAGMVGKIVVR